MLGQVVITSGCCRFVVGSSAEEEVGDHGDHEIGGDQCVHHNPRRSQATLAEAPSSNAECDPDKSGDDHQCEEDEPSDVAPCTGLREELLFLEIEHHELQKCRWRSPVESGSAAADHPGTARLRLARNGARRGNARRRAPSTRQAGCASRTRRARGLSHRRPTPRFPAIVKWVAAGAVAVPP